MKIKEILEKLYDILSNAPDAVLIGVSREFCSYRGFYNELCVAPSIAREIPVVQFYNVLSDQVGKTFTGYKGGEYEMGLNTNLYLAEYGSLGFILKDIVMVTDNVFEFTLGEWDEY